MPNQFADAVVVEYSFPQSNPLRKEVAVLEAYRAHVAERAALGIPPLPLSKQQTTELVALL
nr:hypothetical protein [Dechloromonas sp.]